MGQYKALLLGGAGFLGQGLAKVLPARGCGVRVVDRADCDLADASSVQYLAGVLPGFSHVFLLASQVGAELFETSPEQAGAANRRIYDNVMAAASDARSKGLKVFYYSTSEVFWGMPSDGAYIDGHMVPGVGVDLSNPRSVYAMVKLYAERNLADRLKILGDFAAATVVRPFNVFGPGQRRGVVYSMLKSAFETGRISYADDTTRTLTQLSYISEATADLMDKDGFRAVNMSRGVSTDMKTLAEAVSGELSRDYGMTSVKLRWTEPDKSIRYRQAGPVTRSAAEVSAFLRSTPDFAELAKEVRDAVRG